jgi:ribosomal protein L3
VTFLKNARLLDKKKNKKIKIIKNKKGDGIQGKLDGVDAKIARASERNDNHRRLGTVSIVAAIVGALLPGNLVDRVAT